MPHQGSFFLIRIHTRGRDNGTKADTNLGKAHFTHDSQQADLCAESTSLRRRSLAALARSLALSLLALVQGPP